MSFLWRILEESKASLDFWYRLRDRKVETPHKVGGHPIFTQTRKMSFLGAGCVQ